MLSFLNGITSVSPHLFALGLGALGLFHLGSLWGALLAKQLLTVLPHCFLIKLILSLVLCFCGGAKLPKHSNTIIRVIRKWKNYLLIVQ